MRGKRITEPWPAHIQRIPQSVKCMTDATRAGMLLVQHDQNGWLHGESAGHKRIRKVIGRTGKFKATSPAALTALLLARVGER
jgi:hypothetical protein